MPTYDDDCRYADVLAYRTSLDGNRIEDGIDGEDLAYLGFARDYAEGFGPLSAYLRVRLVRGTRYLPFRLSRFAIIEAAR